MGMNESNEYWKLRDRANKILLRRNKCHDKKIKKELFAEYLWFIRSASKIAPPVDEVWRGTKL